MPGFPGRVIVQLEHFYPSFVGKGFREVEEPELPPCVGGLNPVGFATFRQLPNRLEGNEGHLTHGGAVDTQVTGYDLRAPAVKVHL